MCYVNDIADLPVASTTLINLIRITPFYDSSFMATETRGPLDNVTALSWNGYHTIQA